MTILKGWLCRKLDNGVCMFSAIATRFGCPISGTRGGWELCFHLS
jgi:hypothetical protein